MTTSTGAPLRPLRLWPAVIIAALLVLVRFFIPLVVPDATPFGLPIGIAAVPAGVVGGLALAVWWLFFSRAPWSERLGALVLMIAALFATSRVVDASIAKGMGGMMLPLFAIPVLGLALVAWAVAADRLSTGPRRASMAGSILLVCGAFTVIRTSGVNGVGESDLDWRWTPTPEERLLAAATVPAPTPPRAPLPESRPTAEPGSPIPTPAVAKPADTRLLGEGDVDRKPAAEIREAEWPGFRGRNRDGVVRGVRISTDWTVSPPVELWRRPIGPGWSSFAVDGDLLYTQEQRGDDEVVSCYRLSTGEPVWLHRGAIRFYESNAGAGPRGTPAVRNGRVYALGATGVLNVLDAGNGSVLWSRDTTTDTGVAVPDWGIASSPLVIDDIVVAAISGQLVAYDIRTGERRWLGPKGGAGYSSPHLATIDGVGQILLLRGNRTISVAPADGTLLWEHTWVPGVGIALGIVQPALMPDGDVLIATVDSSGLGIRRVAVTRGSGGWKVEERWTSRGLKPYFNDFVVHAGHAFGFDGSILASIDLANGERTWKGGRYGHGQVVLLPEQDLLLVLSEEGELVLVKASPHQFTELGRVPALEGKAWNHPALVGNTLLVRNGQEMAAFRLPVAAR